MISLLIFTGGIIWGSFLNSIAYRLLNPNFFSYRYSVCPHCKKRLRWYHLIPLLSFYALRGSCGFCQKNISGLYPLIEAITGCTALALYWYTPESYWLAYGVLFSALIISIRTDLEELVIIPYVSIYLVPLGWLFSAFNFLPISLLSSILTSSISYLLLWVCAHIFYRTTGTQGMGEGDFDLIALIGSFLGPIHTLYALAGAAWTGAIFGALYGFYIRNWRTPIPFGPFLALGALGVILYTNYYPESILFPAF